jgi:hypothetical protein
MSNKEVEDDLDLIVAAGIVKAATQVAAQTAAVSPNLHRKLSVVASRCLLPDGILFCCSVAFIMMVERDVRRNLNLESADEGLSKDRFRGCQAGKKGYQPNQGWHRCCCSK